MRELIELVINRGRPEVMEMTTAAHAAGRTRKPRVRGNARRLSESDLQVARQMRQAGRTWRDIGIALGVGESAARKRLSGCAGRARRGE